MRTKTLLALFSVGLFALVGCEHKARIVGSGNPDAGCYWAITTPEENPQYVCADH
jgi:hypothetical protein